VLTPRDYLELSPAAARSQWSSILGRTPVTQGRQVDFTPVETLLCLAASLVVNHRRFGGGTSHLAPAPVPALAVLFRRRNSSILAKMANLDGSRRNGARHEVEVAARLLGEPAELALRYRLILQAARDSGIGAADLPDFLDLEGSDAEVLLLGQEELPESDVEAAVQDASERWLRERADLDELITERLLVATARIGQHRFAHEVLHNHRHRCVFCGLSVRSAGERARRMLVASHIKPWRVCTPTERLDVRNGLTACPTHDVAFDTGLMTVNGGLRIHIAPDVLHSVGESPALRAVFGRPPLDERLLIPDGASTPHAAYLRWHHENVYRSELPATSR
jgi:putative restriction endonuclease